jgi:outer membrane protein OmpU
MKFDTRKALLGTTAIVGASLLAAGTAAAKPTVNIGGSLDFQVGWTSQDHEGWTPTPGGVQGPPTERGYAFFQRTLISIDATDKTDSGMQWAFKLNLNADADGGPGASNGLKDGTARDAADKATLDLSDAWGSVSVGADYTVFRTMSFGSKDATKSAGTGGVDGSWARWYNNKASSSMRFESSTTVRDSTTSTRINYVTPRVMGFQGGVSYAPDRNSIGRYRSPEANVVSTGTNSNSNLEQNWWVGAVNYVNKFGDFDVGLSAAAAEASNSNDSMKNTQSQHYAFVVGYGSWKVGGRYSLKPNSLDIASTSSNYDYHSYDLGVGFTTGPWSFGLSYMREENGVVNGTGTDSNDIWSFGTTYDMGAGLQLYGDLFHAKGKDPNAVNSSVSNNDGTGLITGVRVKF